MDEAPTREELCRQIDELLEKYRARCLWFAPLTYLPQTDEERLRVLGYIQKHGNRAAFIRARELQDWLLVSSK